MRAVRRGAPGPARPQRGRGAWRHAQAPGAGLTRGGTVRQVIQTLSVATRGRGLVEITEAVRRFVATEGIGTGLLTVWCRHTSASLLVQENADPDVRADLEAFLEPLAREPPGRYVHAAEGPDDMPAHLRAALTQTQL